MLVLLLLLLPQEGTVATHEVTVLAQDKPVAGVKVHAQYYNTHGLKTGAIAVTNEQGKARVSIRPEGDRPFSLECYANDDRGRIGKAYWYTFHDEATVIRLLEPTTLRGKVTGTTGEALAGVKLHVSQFDSKPDDQGNTVSISIPTQWKERYSTTSASDGTFSLPGVPQGHRTTLHFDAPGHGMGMVFAKADQPSEFKLNGAGEVRLSCLGGEPTLLNGVHWSLNPRSRPDAVQGQLVPLFSRYDSFKDKSPQILNVAAGEYELTLFRSLEQPMHPPAKLSVKVEAGKTTLVPLTMQPAARLRGRVVNRATKAGIPRQKVQVVEVLRGNSIRPIGILNADEQGRFTAYVPSQMSVRVITLSSRSEFHLPARGENSESPLNYTLKPGEEKTQPDLELDPAVTLTGVVRGEPGQPLAPVTIYLPYLGDTVQRLMTDEQGRFTLSGFPPDVSVELPRFKRGDAVSVPRKIDLDRGTAPLTIELSEKQACKFSGTVMTSRGKPLAGAKVKIQWFAEGSGRFHGTGTTLPIETLTTAVDGTFVSSGLWPNDRYSITIRAEGYNSTESNLQPGTAGKTTDLGTFRLHRTSAMVTGIVQDTAGKPLAGVTVFNAGDSPAYISTSTDADGRFQLKGFYEGNAFVLARHEGYRLTHLAVETDGTPVTITMTKYDEPARFVPKVDADATRQRDKLTRHLLTSLWKERASLGGYERNVFRGMADFDLATATRWRDEEPVAAVKQTYTSFLLEAQRRQGLLPLAMTDMDEAIDQLRGAKGREASVDVLHLARQLLEKDKGLALRVLEEATLVARALELPDRIWTLAEVGGLVERAGNAEAGKKLILEAAEMAEKTSHEGRDTFARGYAARYLAIHDLERAKKLIQPLKAGEYNRWLEHIAFELVVHDRQRAIALLKEMQADGTSVMSNAHVILALRIAPKDPAEAEKLLQSIDDPHYQAYRVVGLAKLANVLSTTHPTEAKRLINQAKESLSSGQYGRSLGYFGGNGSLAMMIVTEARQAGYAELGELVTWALTQRPRNSNDAYDSRNRLDQLCKHALLLSSVDTATARQAMGCLGTPERLVEQGLEHSRDWLFTLAIADPPLAEQLINRLMEQVHRQPQKLQRSGLIELITVLKDQRTPGRRSANFLSLLRVGEEPD